MKKEFVRNIISVVLAAVFAMACTSAAFAAEPSADGGTGTATALAKDATAQGYTPSDGAAKYIKEMVSAKLLTPAVYDKPFYDDMDKVELATYASALYRYLGGAGAFVPVSADTSTDEDEWGYGDYYGDYVSKGEALANIAKAVTDAVAAERSKLPSVEAARTSLGKVYLDSSDIEDEYLPYIGFLYARGALLLSFGEQPGSAFIHAKYDMTRNEFFLLLSDAAWAFAKARLSPHAQKPADPTHVDYVYQSYFMSVYKDNANIYWNNSAGAYCYNVSIYVAGKLKKKLAVGYSGLSLTKYTNPTYRSVFGNLKKKKTCYLNVQAQDRHGVKSKKTLRVNFYAEKFVNVNQKIFGSKTRFGFKSAKTAKKHQKNIKVKVWKLVGKKKVRSSMWLTVNKEVADDVKKIFAEIYKGKEKFPVNAMGGFQIRSSKTSEHNYGTAIDINPNENCMKDGNKVTAGKFWRPGKNKYSIKKNGDVVKAFEKYGWYWGGNGWGDRKDYMHFSYFHG